MSPLCIRTGTPLWYKLYSARSSYGMAGLRPSDWSELLNKMKSNDEIFDLYFKYAVYLICYSFHKIFFSLIEFYSLDTIGEIHRKDRNVMQFVRKNSFVMQGVAGATIESFCVENKQKFVGFLVVLFCDFCFISQDDVHINNKRNKAEGKVHRICFVLG